MADDETPDGLDDGGASAAGRSGASGAATWWRESGWGPWVVIGAALLVVLGVIVVGGGDDDPSAARSGGATASTAAPAPDGGDSSKPDSKAPDDCADFSLGANLLGVPGVASEPGVHVWHDVEGFHVRRVVGGDAPEAVSGTVTPTGPELQLVAPSAPAASASGGAITFELSGTTDEVLFKAPCSTSKVTFDFRSGGAPLAADVVTVGRGETPPGVPFTLERGGA